MKYGIVFRASVKKDLRRIPQLIVERLKAVLLSLRDNPFQQGSEKLQGHDHYYRIRVGQYRIIYEVTTEIRIITIIRIAHRKEVYRIL